MLRLVVENVLLFLLPTLLYVAYILLRRHLDDGSQSSNQSSNQQAGTPNAGPGPSPGAGAPPDNVFSDAPFIWLALVGAGLVFAVLLLFGSVSTSNPNGTYEPAVYKDGKVVPGRIK
jgi:hypothetical protein